MDLKVEDVAWCGVCQVDIELPYYMQVLGLGAGPYDTRAHVGAKKSGLSVNQQPGLDNRAF